MHRIKKLFFVVMMGLLASSCIKSFIPKIKTADAKKYVVSSQISNNSENQTVTISMTSSINDPHYEAVNGCQVIILDNKGDAFPMDEMGNGQYSTWINPKFLMQGDSLKVEITTPSGEKLSSDFDGMSKSSAVDSVYYIRKDIEGNIPGQFTHGIQFYLNLRGDDSDSRYYRWNVFETWEYHTQYPLQWYYDGTVHHVSPPDYSRKVCWRTMKRPKIFTLSTSNLLENKYNGFPLQFVDNRTPRLAYGYSMLVEQLSISEAAYNYWDQLRINSSTVGGLYEKQPLAIKGNMHNLSHPDKEVLGFFGVASVSYKRIFVSNVPGLPLDFPIFCSPSLLEHGFIELSPRDYPAYLMDNKGKPTMMWMGHECVNCLLQGGTNIKPDFWPK